MHMTDTHFVITVPRFAGYKTLVINAAVLLFGMLSVIWPAITPPDIGALGMFYDQATGGIIAIIGALNIALRFMTTTPVGGAVSGGGGMIASGSGETRLNESRMMLAGALSPRSTVGEVLAADASLAKYLASKEQALRASADMPDSDDGDSLYPTHPCSWPDCPCHQRCDEKRPNMPVIDAHPSVKAAKRVLHRRTMQTFFAALLAPSLLLAGAVGVASLGGCATANQINAIASAESVEQRAFALYGSFVVLEERAAELVQDRSIPKATRKRIQLADKVAKPLADRVRGLAVDLNAARLAYNTSLTGAEKVTAAVNALSAALAQLAPAVAELSASLKVVA